MIFPTLSVTIIGALVGAMAATRGRRSIRSSLLVGFFGAWAGFALGASIGVLIDVAAGTGATVFIAGHAAAVGGALVACRSRRFAVQRS